MKGERVSNAERRRQKKTIRDDEPNTKETERPTREVSDTKETARTTRQKQTETDTVYTQMHTPLSLPAAAAAAAESPCCCCCCCW